MSNIIEWFRSRSERKAAQKRAEDESMARIENAERDLAALRARGEKAVRVLTERNTRNHWGEAITDMITGARS